MSDKNTFGIGIPTLNRYDLLKESLLNYRKDFPNIRIYVLDNGIQGIDVNGIDIIIPETEKGYSVGKSWNVLCDFIFKEHSHALILNDDVYLGSDEAFINKMINSNIYQNYFIRSTADWSAFIIPKNMFEKIGRFDECFYPAYYEDSSYEYRMKLAMAPVYKTPSLNPVIYRRSMTVEKSPEIVESSIKNKIKYIEMWGGEPGSEIFKKPYTL